MALYVMGAPVLLHCATPTDSIHQLNSLEVSSDALPQGVMHSSTGTIVLNSASLLGGMHFGGESDVMATLRMLPGFTSGSDYASGISVDGANYSQSSHSIDRAPVLFPFHFGGIFSTFNTPHYRAFRVERSGAHTAPLRIGGNIDAITASTVPDSTEAVVNGGMLASSATVSMPVGGKSAVTASARVSYINAIYSKMLEDGDNATRYAFADFNISALHCIDAHNTIKFSGFLNDDVVKFIDGTYALDTKLCWSNALSTLAWLHRSGDTEAAVRTYYTTSSSELRMALPASTISLPSNTSIWSIQAETSNERTGWHMGAAFDYQWFSPQGIESEGELVIEDRKFKAAQKVASLFASKKISLGRGIIIDAGARAWMADGDVCCLGIDPRCVFTYTHKRHALRATVSLASQLMQQVGFSDIGVASDFWIPVNKSVKPLRAAGVDVEYTAEGVTRWLSVDLSLYAKHISHEAEYRGDIVGVINPTYDPIKSVSTSNGFNTGVNVNLRLHYGSLSGWAGYSLGVARRHFAESPHKWLPSATEPLHSVKALAQWRVNNHISLSAFFTLASGRRYTPVRALYIVGGNILTEYGERNSGHLPLYHRLDLSATYHLPPIRIGSKRVRSQMNLSVINAYGHRNIEVQYFSYNQRQHTISLHQASTLYRFLPSISYTLML